MQISGGWGEAAQSTILSPSTSNCSFISACWLRPVLSVSLQVSIARITTVVLVLAAAAAGGVAIATAGSGRANKPITEAQAIAFAQAVNLRPNDLRGSTSVHPKGFRINEALAGERQRSRRLSPEAELPCMRLGMTGSRPVGGASSVLISSYGFVVSDVLVMPSGTLAAFEFAALDTSRGRTCLARLLGRSMSVEGDRKTTSFAVKVMLVRVAKLLGPRAVAVHVLAELPPAHEKGEEQTRATFFHAAATCFRVGPAEILLLTDEPTRQLPAAIEHRLLSLLHDRAEAHKL